MKVTSTPRPDIAVVGVSAIFPGSGQLTGFWNDIMEGRDMVTDVPETHWLIDDYYDPDPSAEDKTYCKRGAFLDPTAFDCMTFGTPPSLVQQTDTTQLLALLAAKQVLEDAARGPFDHLDKSRMSVILGATGATELLVHMGSRLQRPIWLKSLRDAGVPEAEAQAICQRIADHYVPWTEAAFPGLLGNVIAGRIANRFDLGGTNCVVDAACASAQSAVAMALNELYMGQSDMVITGGADTLNDIVMYMCFSKTPALSPSGDCRPFSDQADGTIIGEGIGMLALRRLEDAERDGDRIYAVIKAMGSSSDGRAKSVYAPSSEGQAKALRRTYEAAGYGVDTVELVEAHGTGTKAGDAAEFGGLNTVFEESGRKDRNWCALGSIKSQIGHTKAAAGSASLVKTVLALHHKVLPPTIKVDRPNPNLNIDQTPFYINTKSRPWIRGGDHPRRASVSSFGFGGSNFHVTLEEYTGPAKREGLRRPSPTELVLLSADTPAQLLDQARTLLTDRKGPDALRFTARLTQEQFNASLPVRLAIVAGTRDELAKKLDAAVAAVEKNPNVDKQAPNGWYYTHNAAAGEIAFLFPGQGSQYVNMGADLAMAYDEARAVWDRIADLQLDPEQSLHQVVFPKPAFDDETRAAQELALKATQWAQPAIGAVALSHLALLNTMGVKPAAAAGHSFGELAALYAAGVMNQTDFMRTARKRGELMAEASAGLPGAMTVVSHPVDDLKKLNALQNDGVVIANYNSPKQVVLSGKVEAMERLEAELQQKDIRFKRLPVATAFHSPIVSEASRPLIQFLKGVDLNPPAIPVYANQSAATYAADVDAVRTTISDQIAHPVRWVEQIQAMYAAGVRTFVEVGPGDVLTNLVKDILADKTDIAVINMDRKNQHGLTALQHAVGRLAIRGVQMDLAAMWAGVEPVIDPATIKPSKLSVDINGVNYNKPYPPKGGAAALPKPNPPRQAPAPAPVTKAAPAPVAKAAPAAQTQAKPAPKTAPAAKAAPQPMQRPVAQTTPVAPKAAITPSTIQKEVPPMTFSPQQPTPTTPVSQTEAGQWISAFQEMQQHTVDAHMTFLRVAERSMMGLESMLHRGAAPVHQQQPAAPMAYAAPQPASVVQPAPVAAQPTPVAPRPVAPAPAPVAKAAPAPQPVVQAAPAPVAKAAPAPVAKAAPALDLNAVMLEIVAEKTGYPTDMLELTMELESDLGIDSIKRVEILSAMQERVPNLPKVDPSDLATLRTLGEIADYMSQKAGVSAPAANPAPVAQAAPAAPAVDLNAVMLEIVAEKTGYPSDMLELTMELESDLGIDSIKRVEILSAMQERVPNLPKVDPSDLATLRTLGEIAGYMAQKAGASAAAPVAAAPAAPALDLNAIMQDIVAEKTGYPSDMLELTMELESDLGIDSIKRVEILSAVQERVPNLPKVDPTEMATLRTLGEIADYMAQKAGAVAPAPASVAAAPAAPALDLNAIMQEIVAEKTGYPADMLELTMELESDLGIDSIKRVEILSAVQERVPNLPKVDPTEMATLRTLGEIADYMAQKAGAVAPAPVAAAPAVPAAPAAPALDLNAIMQEIVAEKTGYPANMLELSMELESDLGIDSIKRVEILSAVQERVPNLPKVDPTEMATLRTLGEIADYMAQKAGVAPTAAPVANATQATPQAATQTDQDAGVGRFVVDLIQRPLPGLAAAGLYNGDKVLVTDEGTGIAPKLVAELQSLGIRAELVDTVPADARNLVLLDALAPVTNEEQAMALNRRVFEKVLVPAASMEHNGGFLMIAQDTGGDFAFGSTDTLRPWSGGLTGLAKTASQEWPKACVRAVDIDRADRSPEQLAELLAREITLGGADLEIGLKADGARLTPRASQAQVEPQTPVITSQSVVVASGGARGVTAASLIALAQDCAPTFALLGRTALTDEPACCNGVADEPGLKKALMTDAVAKGEKPHPRELGRQVARIQSNREIRATLAALEAAGSKARYIPCDITDPASTAAALDDVRNDLGPITTLVHGAGVIADKMLSQKTMDQFDMVFNTKIVGLRNLLQATQNDPITGICLFSSVAGRSGNAGQSDYAVANEVLNRLAEAECNRRDNCTVKSINWGPWASGMVTPALRAKFDALGVTLIPLDEGAQIFVDEMKAGTTHRQVVVGGAPRQAALLTPHAATARDLEVVVGPTSHPHLLSHRIEGAVVVPVVQVLDWFASAAGSLHPDHIPGTVRGLQVFSGIRLEDFESLTTRFRIHAEPAGELTYKLTLFDVHNKPRYGATVQLSATPLTAPTPAPQLELAEVDQDGASFYDKHLFHGPDFHALKRITAIGESGAEAQLIGSRQLNWTAEPDVTDAALLDGGLQVALVWAYETLGGRRSLPMSFDSFTRYAATPEDGFVRLVLRGSVEPLTGSESDLWFLDQDGKVIAQITGLRMHVIGSGKSVAPAVAS